VVSDLICRGGRGVPFDLPEVRAELELGAITGIPRMKLLLFLIAECLHMVVAAS